MISLVQIQKIALEYQALAWMLGNGASLFLAGGSVNWCDFLGESDSTKSGCRRAYWWPRCVRTTLVPALVPFVSETVGRTQLGFYACDNSTVIHLHPVQQANPVDWINRDKSQKQNVESKTLVKTSRYTAWLVARGRYWFLGAVDASFSL